MEDVNMRMNVKKKVMRINCEENGTPHNITIDGLQQMSFVTKVVLSREGRCTKEVKRKIGITRKASKNMKHFILFHFIKKKRRKLTFGNLNFTLKKKTSKSTCMEYIARWSRNMDVENEIKRLEVCEM